jgi:hypothetical protein
VRSSADKSTGGQACDLEGERGWALRGAGRRLCSGRPWLASRSFSSPRPARCGGPVPGDTNSESPAPVGGPHRKLRSGDGPRRCRPAPRTHVGDATRIRVGRASGILRPMVAGDAGLRRLRATARWQSRPIRLCLPCLFPCRRRYFAPLRVDHGNVARVFRFRYSPREPPRAPLASCAGGRAVSS